jgi:hypothetical protein
MTYENLRLTKINDERARLPVIPPFETYRDAGELLDATRNYIDSHRRLWRQGFAMSRDSAEAARRGYIRLREALLSLGADISGLPRRLKLKVAGVR